MIEQFSFEILCLLAAVILAGVFLALCKLGVVPDPIAKHALAIAAITITFGLLPFIKVCFPNDKRRQPSPVIVDTVSPTRQELVLTDEQVEESRAEIEEVRAELADIKEEEVKSRDRPDSDPCAGSIARDRLRRLQGG